MSLRDRLLALLVGRGEEKPLPIKASAPAIAAYVKSPEERKLDEAKQETGAQDNVCPRCGAPNSFNEIAANTLRCCACGHQAISPPKRPAVRPVIIEPRSATPTECSCGSKLLTAIGGGGLRCGTCGKQTGVEHPNGLSRKDLENYEGKPAHAQMNGVHFSRRSRDFPSLDKAATPASAW